MKPQGAGRGGFTEFELGCQNWNTMFKPPRLESDWLRRLAEASMTFGKPSQKFLQVLGISLKSLESSLRKPEHSLGFLCDPQITISLLYNTRLCLSKISSLLPTHNSLDLRPNLRELLSSGLSAKPQSAGRGGFTEFELGFQNRNTMFKFPKLKSDWL